MKRPILIYLFSLLFIVPLNAVPMEQNRITFHGRDLFLNGLNLAWSSFANDIGPDPATPDLAHFERVFQEMNENGANVMRLWLHTTGAYTPAWEGHTVTGPGVDTIEDLRAILDLAWQYDCAMMLCLWSFDMLRISNGRGVTDRAMAILTEADKRKSYIDNALIPMVDALKGHPAILCWEIFNEPEGMSVEHGWDFNRHVPMADIQAFVNQCAGAIRRTDPDVMVSNGSWAFIAATDVGPGNFNYYTDERLVAAGGDLDGTLHFFMVHYYDWAGTSRSPFHHPASHWQLDKPLVVAEFYPNCANCTESSHLKLFESGYAGALSWSWTDVVPQTMLDQIHKVSSRHAEHVLLRPDGRPEVQLTLPEAQAWFRNGAVVEFAATAQADPGGVDKVVFYVDGQKQGEAAAPGPYSLSVNDLSVGEHVAHAVVVGKEQRRARSEGVPFRVGRSELLGRLEAEDAAYSGVALRSDTGASGGACLEMKSSGHIEWTVEDVPVAADYELRIGYNLVYDSPKTNNLVVNGSPTALVFNSPVGQWAEKVVTVRLQQGTNTIRITPAWGWMLFDYIAIPSLAQASLPELQLKLDFNPAGSSFLVYGPPGLQYELMGSSDLQLWSSDLSITPDQTPARLPVPAAAFAASPRYYRILHNPLP